jgi:hypothetical protein
MIMINGTVKQLLEVDYVDSPKMDSSGVQGSIVGWFKIGNFVQIVRNFK